MRQNALEPLSHPAPDHDCVIAETHHTAMSARFNPLDMINKYYRLSYLHTGPSNYVTLSPLFGV
jgi:hypothetical protein